MSQVACYVDGFNLYHAINELARPELKWLNLRALAASFLEKHDVLVSVVYFTALMKWDPGKIRRHRQYITALEASNVEVIESKFQKNNRFCKGFTRYCDFYDEKQTDVAFAVRVFRDIQLGIVDRAILVTADSDHVPLVSTVRDAFPLVSIDIAAPPKRMRRARELCNEASRFYEISEGRLRTCLLLRNVADAAGHVVASCPADYLPA